MPAPAPAPLETTSAPQPEYRAAPSLLRAVTELTIQEYLLLFYALLMWVAAVQGSGVYWNFCLSFTSGAMLVLVTMLMLVRTGRIARGLGGALAYRAVVCLYPIAMYLILRELLPTATNGNLDEQLYQLDLRLLGFEPTLWTDQFITPFTVSWFSFFYYSYFWFLAVHVFPMLFARMELQASFALTVLSVMCFGHLLYLVVPGYGPITHLADKFPHHDFPPGFWHDMVMDVVKSSGAMKDIFPSLHTAAPTVLALWCLRNRHLRPFKYTWPVSLFFAIQMIGATIFLRWHWLVDVIAGLALAFFSVWAGPKFAAWELKRRDRLGQTRAWPELVWPWQSA